MSCEEHQHFQTHVEFASNQPQEGSPETEFLQDLGREPTLRKFFNDEMRFSDGREVEIWTFEDESSGRAFPAPLVRVQEGEVFQALLKPSKGPHTIHWHGIEPDPRNDGVGHTSFEVTGGYTFQWITEKGVPGDPNKGTAGTFFYHCHVNTVLHVQMGMFGPLIVDPIVHPDFPVADPVRTRRVFVDGPTYDLATETLLVPYSLDPDWHEFTHAAGLSGENVGLNDFSPRNFYLLGAQDLRSRRSGEGPAEVGALDIVNAQRPFPLASPDDVGSRAPTLIRVINANYFPTVLTFTNAAGKPVKLGEVVGHDGRPFRNTASTGPSMPIRGSSPIDISRLAFGAAERYDILLWPTDPSDPDRNGTRYTLTLEWFHWVNRDRYDRFGQSQKLASRSIQLNVI